MDNKTRRRFRIMFAGVILEWIACAAAVPPLILAGNRPALIWVGLTALVGGLWWSAVLGWMRITGAYCGMFQAHQYATERADRWRMLYGGVMGGLGATGETIAAWMVEKRGDEKVDHLGTLALMLGGSEDSFTGQLLRLIAKAQGTPANFSRLAEAFPDAVTAWATWQTMDPTPTVAELAAEIAAVIGHE